MLNLLIEAFSRLFRPAVVLPASTSVRKHAFLGDAQLSAWKDLLLRGQWQPVHDALAGLKDPHRLELAINGLTELPDRPRWLDDCVRERQGSATALLLRGAHAIHWAWEARSGKRAAQVERSAWPVFYERLQLALADLRAVVQREPGHAVAWAQMLPALTGLQVDPAEAQQVFRQAIAACPTLRGAHEGMLMRLCHKWGGTHPRMFGFAREVSASRPQGCALHALIPAAHLERWLYFGMDNDEEGQQQYFSRTEVRQEIEGAFQRLGDGPDVPDRRWAGNSFALALYFSNLPKLTGKALAMTQGIVTNTPWGWYDDPVAGYRRALAWAGGK